VARPFFVEQNMIPVRYIGGKPLKTDNVAHTPTVWHGHGDVQMVEPKTWEKLQAHPNVWQLAEEPAPTASTDSKPVNTDPPPLKYELVMTEDGKDTAVVLDAMDLDALKAFNTKHKLGVDNRIRDVQRFREALFAAATVEA
jgi:hypothetical protein